MKQLRVLVVDDDYFFRGVLSQALEGMGHQVTKAEDGEIAKAAIELHDFDIVLSDIRMAKVSGFELLSWIKQTKSMPVILMTGFSELVEAKEGHTNGADGFLPKPFKRDALEQAIQVALSQKEAKKEPENLDDQFRKIKIDDFVTGSSIKHDIHIRLSASKYVRFAHSGADISVDKIQHLKSKGIHFLYLKKEDFQEYVALNATLTRAVANSGKIEHSRKLKFFTSASNIVMENFYHNDIDRSALEASKAVLDSCLNSVSEQEDLFHILESLKGSSDYLYAHSVGVSFYAAMLGRKAGWQSQATLYNLSLGGLLHDIGFKELPQELFNKSRAAMSADEIALFETHPFRGMQLLQDVASLPTDVVHIVFQHHEDRLGTGYPQHLDSKRTHPLARVLHVADKFCELVLKGPKSPGLSPKEAFERIILLYATLMEPQVLIALGKLLQMEMPEAFWNAYPKLRKAA